MQMPELSIVFESEEGVCAQCFRFGFAKAFAGIGGIAAPYSMSFSGPVLESKRFGESLSNILIRARRWVDEAHIDNSTLTYVGAIGVPMVYEGERHEICFGVSTVHRSGRLIGRRFAPVTNVPRILKPYLSEYTKQADEKWPRIEASTTELQEATEIVDLAILGTKLGFALMTAMPCTPDKKLWN